MPSEVIATVHQLAAACKKYKGIMFTDRNGNVIDDDNDDKADDTLEITGVDDTNYDNTNYDNTNYDNTNYDNTNYDNTNYNNENESDTNYNTVEITGVPENDTPITELPENNTTEHTTPPETTGVTRRNLQDTEMETENDIAQDTNYEPDSAGQYHNTYYEQGDDDVFIENEMPEDIHVTINDMNTVHEMNAGQLNVDPDTGEEIEEEPEEPRHGYNLRPRPTKRNQKYNMTNIGQQSTIAKPHLHVILNQVGIREGLRMFGEEGNNALLKELNQLHERNALLPKKKEDMTYEERKKVLRYLMFLKEKRDRSIKARGCADGRSQREYTTKAETSSPTISLEAMMMSCAIHGRRRTHVARGYYC